MRPAPGVEAPAPRSRKSSSADRHQPPSFISPAGPTTFFLASESELGRTAASNSNSSSPNSCPPRKAEKTTCRDGYGVQSLDDTLDEAFGDRAEDDLLAQEEATGEGDMLHRLLRMRRKRNFPTTTKPPPAAADSDNKSKGEEDPFRSARPDVPSTPRGAARSNSPLQRRHRRLSHTTISQPLTPLMVESPTPFGSACPSTPKSESMRSLRLSEEDDALTEDNTSQAIVSSDEEDGGRGVTRENDRGRLSTSAPELVMPSLALPSRRPFTARGRQIGRLKICVAGMKSSGKTSMIRAIFQRCEDIVHIDPVAAAQPRYATSRKEKSNSKTKSKVAGTTQIVEICASTRAYPIWWTDGEESRNMRRRKSSEDVILERNLSIIDSPGYAAGDSQSEDHVAAYIESLFRRNSSISAMNKSDLLNVLTGSGGVQVDLVLFVFSADGELSPQIDRFKRLSSLANVVPLVGKADTLDAAALVDFKRSIMLALQSSVAKPFLFGFSIQETLDVLHSAAVQPPGDESEDCATKVSFAQQSDEMPAEPLKTPQPAAERSTTPPFAVSTLSGSDEQEMDASLLMSSSYNPPLVSSDLQYLISLIFDPENVSWLRHNAVRKFLAWQTQRQATEGLSGGGDSMLMNDGALGIREEQFSKTVKSPTSQLVVSRPPGSTRISPFNLSSTSNVAVGVSDLTMARIRDHTAREEALAQVQLKRWASELQRAMQHERNQYEALMSSERARWLLAKINEEVQSGNIGAVDTDGIIRRLPDAAPPASTRPRNALSNQSTSAWPLAPSCRSHRETELPSWARPRPKGKGRLNPEDPLGVCEMGDSMRRTGSTVAKVVGGSVVVTAAYFALVGAVHRFNGASPDPHGFFWAPRFWNISAWITQLFGFEDQ